MAEELDIGFETVTPLVVETSGVVEVVTAGDGSFFRLIVDVSDSTKDDMGVLVFGRALEVTGELFDGLVDAPEVAIFDGAMVVFEGVVVTLDKEMVI